MQQVLVLKSAIDKVYQDLMDYVDKNYQEVYCLIQSSRKQEYEKKYPHVHFIDCKKEAFYEIPREVLDTVESISYDKIFLPITRVKAYNFGNVMEMIRHVKYKKLVFYYANGEIFEIDKMGKIQSIFYGVCIKLFEKIYG